MKPPLMFHHFHGDGHPPRQGSLSADDLRAIIDHVGRERLLSARAWVERLLAGSLAPDDGCLTFDDALRCQFDIARPVLRQAGLTGLWFVYSSPLEGEVSKLEVYSHFRATQFVSVDEFYDEFIRQCLESDKGQDVRRSLDGFDPGTYLTQFSFYTTGDRVFRFLRDKVLGERNYDAVMAAMIDSAGLSPEDLSRELIMDEACLRDLDREGHVLGLHSHSHPTTLSALPLKDQEREYRLNAAFLSRISTRPIICAAHPCNSYSDDTIGVLRDLGIGIAFCSNESSGYGDVMTYPRKDSTLLMREIGRRDF